MVEGVRFRYIGYDRATSQVLVETDDGKVPIELISQGTQSLLGWVGILLERLYNVYPDVRQPRDRYALVAIDEIDAHMHPAWQQSMVPHLSQLFPNTQFIASTHSPLVVADLERTQVYILNRDPETKQISAVHPSTDFDSYRADQMLTSPLFGLVRVRSHKFDDATDRYSELLSKPKRTKAEEAEFESLRVKLSEQLLSSTTPAQQQVEQAVRQVLLQTWSVESAVQLPSQADLPEELDLELKRQVGGLLGEKETKA
jgi:predicted ATP-binding protein involved in virulence